MTLNRTGGSTGAVGVTYSTLNGTAVAGTDYTTVSGTVSWASGDTGAKSISIPVSNGSAFSGVRTFSIAIAAPTGSAVLGAVAAQTISIVGTQVAANAVGSTAAARLLMQGTFGATPTDIATVATQSYDTWFTAQAAQPVSLELPKVANWNDDRLPAWWANVIKGPDQLRMRTAYALSQILVISKNNAILYNLGQGRAYYADILNKNALGNFRTLLDAVARSPEMGFYLSYFKNDKPNTATGVHADENFARELMQLFTIGLWKLNPDGTQQLDGSGNPIPTYAQAEVTNLARVLTGWASGPYNGRTGASAWDYDWTNGDVLNPMACYSAHHDTDAKTIVSGVTIPAGGTCDSDLKIALDTLFNHPNMAPFIGKQLIQRMVTSNPSPGYVSRVSAVFANNGKGVRGDLLAVVKAILTDPEATTASTGATAGKLREPVLKLTGLWRAFSASDSQGQIRGQVTTNATQDFGQNSLEANTVFNFYRPDYQRAGALTDAKLYVPEFQITNESTIILASNDLEWQSYIFQDSTGRSQLGQDYVSGQSSAGSNDVVLKTAAWESLASDPNKLVDTLNLVFMAGQMPATMKSTLVNYVTAIPASTPANRVVESAQLLLNSPQYSIQR